MSNVHPLVPNRAASAQPPASTPQAQRSAWLAVCESAWRAGHTPGVTPQRGPVGAVRAVRREAQAAGDEFVVAAADVVLLDVTAREGDLAAAVAGLVSAVADLETFPASVWGARADAVLAAAFADLGERDLAVEHHRRRQGIGEALDDLAVQADALHAVALLMPDGAERLDAFATAESLYARAGIDDDDAARGGVVARLDRALTNLRLGLVAAAAEQLPTVVDQAGRLDLPATRAAALAALAECAGLSGQGAAGLAHARDALAVVDTVPAGERTDAQLGCARAFVACGHPELAVALLDAPDMADLLDPRVREECLTVLAQSFHVLGVADRAFDCLRRADEVGARLSEHASHQRLDAMRAYHRSRTAERDLSDQRDLSARLLEQVAHLAGESSVGSDLAVRDDVTGLPNRRYLDLELRWRCAQRLPADGVLGLTLVTIDRFDTLGVSGPGTPDRVARLVGQVVRGNVRGGDAVARFGVDTFAVIQFHRSPDAVRYGADRLHGAVRSFPWAEHGVDVNVTVSVGTAALTPPTTPGGLVTSALAALAVVVDRGGDGVRWSAPEAGGRGHPAPRAAGGGERARHTGR